MGAQKIREYADPEAVEEETWKEPSGLKTIAPAPSLLPGLGLGRPRGLAPFTPLGEPVDLAPAPSSPHIWLVLFRPPGPALLPGHESYVTFCHLEDEAAFTCSADCTIRKWDVRTGQCLQVFRGHTSIVNRILVADNQLFSGSYDRTARAWSVDKGQVSQEFRGHRNCVLTLAYSAPWDLPGAPCAEEAGGLLVTGSTDGTARVWQVAGGGCWQTLRGHTGAVLCLVLDTPSHTAFTGSTDATIRAWDILSGEQLRVFREHQGPVICLELVNRHVYSGSADRTVKCWLADTGERVRTFAAHGHSVSALKYHAGTWCFPVRSRSEEGWFLIPTREALNQ
ncbi:WD repeat-containing protein 86 [Herpailurus yagouaroundi]|uniref:WD repeat-containing protein 86 n=1 Tax=Herpailurus yagouaroundi TaxID=1608482 RepID=UPI001AD728C3|nr:WD repeat-containing protein 86 [Puma yagouaroundi]